MRRSTLLLIGCLGASVPAVAQESPPAPTVAAARILAMREEIALDSAQVVKLQALEKTQVSALAKSTADFYRAEADVIDALRGEDPVVRRAALEKRSRVVVDAELARWKAEKDARAILTAKQLADGTVSFASLPRPLWYALVSPLNVAPPPPVVADSGELRISVSPNYADIFINGEKRGTGRRAVTVAVGSYEITLVATNCERKYVRVTVAKAETTIVNQTLTCTQ